MKMKNYCVLAALGCTVFLSGMDKECVVFPKREKSVRDEIFESIAQSRENLLREVEKTKIAVLRESMDSEQDRDSRVTMHNKGRR